MVRALFRRARGPSWLRTAPAAPLPCRQRIVPDDTIETRCSAATTGPRDVVAVGSRTNAAAFAPHADCRWRLRPLTGRRATAILILIFGGLRAWASSYIRKGVRRSRREWWWLGEGEREKQIVP